MSWILLTNDDGIGSPALAPFAAALTAIAPVRVCVPDGERSWSGKSMTRFAPIEAGPRTPLPDTLATWSTSGTPADAANIGLYAMAEEPPSLVVSGINIGSNVGTAFLLSSGTVGAALEGWLAGVPAIAVSTRSATLTWGTWVRHATSDEASDGWRRLAGVCAAIVADLVATPLPEVADVVTVNLPWEATTDTPRRITDVARVGYGPLFAEGPVPGQRRFTFDGSLLAMDELAGTDVEALELGHVSITPLGAPAAVPVDADLRRRVEQG